MIFNFPSKKSFKTKLKKPFALQTFYRAFGLSLLLCLFPSDSCLAVSIVSPGKANQPWFTGSLLTPSARVIGVGQVNIEPYLIWSVTNGRYNSHWKAEKLPSFNQIVTQLNFKTGIYEKLDFSITIQSFLSFVDRQSGSSFGDFWVGASYQLYHGGTEKEPIYFKFSIQEVFPTGKYQKLNPENLRTDSGGLGCFITKIGLTYSSLKEVSPKHFLAYRFHIASSISAPFGLHGWSVYGGDRSTRGTVCSRTALLFLSGMEYTLSKEFVFACDFEAHYVHRGRFRGTTILPIRLQESFQCGLAPAIEYNWNPSMGIIVGSWFSIIGRNSSRFVSFVGAFNYSF